MLKRGALGRRRVGMTDHWRHMVAENLLKATIGPEAESRVAIGTLFAGCR